jgi:hypothetical protein
MTTYTPAQLERSTLHRRLRLVAGVCLPNIWVTSKRMDRLLDQSGRIQRKRLQVKRGPPAEAVAPLKPWAGLEPAASRFVRRALCPTELPEVWCSLHSTSWNS